MKAIMIELSDDDYDRIIACPKCFNSLTSRVYEAVQNGHLIGPVADTPVSNNISQKNIDNETTFTYDPMTVQDKDKFKCADYELVYENMHDPYLVLILMKKYD